MLSFSHWINLFYFLLLFFFFLHCLFPTLHVHACVYIPLFLWIHALFCICHLYGVSILFSCFSVFVFIPFNAITNRQWYLTSLARDQAQNLWSGSTDKSLDRCKPPNPREYLLVRIPIKASTCIHLASPNCQQHPV